MSQLTCKVVNPIGTANGEKYPLRYTHVPDWRSKRELLNQMPLNQENWKHQDYCFNYRLTLRSEPIPTPQHILPLIEKSSAHRSYLCSSPYMIHQPQYSFQ